MGRLSMRRCSMVSVEELRWVSTKLASELTFTTSFAPAIERTIGKLAICPTVMATSLISILAKPGLSTVTVYAPGGSARMRYSPSLFTVVERSRSQRSEEHTSELQSRPHLVCRLLLEKKKPSQKCAWTAGQIQGRGR